jgi:WD40 repeat protein
MLAFAVHDGVKRWDPDTGESVRVIQHNDIIDFCMSADGTKIATIGKAEADNATAIPVKNEYDIQLWDVATYGLVGAFEGHKGKIYDIKFGWSGYQLASAGDDGIRLWDMTSLACIKQFGLTCGPGVLFFTHDDLKLIMQCDDPESPSCKMWDVLDGAESRIGPISGHNEIKVAIHPAQNVLAIAKSSFCHQHNVAICDKEDGVVALWDVDGEKEISTLATKQRSITHIAFNHDASKVVALNRSSIIKIWDIKRGTLVGEIEVPHARSIYMCPCSNRTAVVQKSVDKSKKYSIAVYDDNLKFQRPSHEFNEDLHDLTWVCFYPHLILI